MARANDKVCLGRIAGAHGVRGELRVESYTAAPADIVSYGSLRDEAGGRHFVLTLAGVTRGQLIARVKGVDDRNAAEALKGVELFVERAALPPTEDDEYYLSDLIGLSCESTSGESLGFVRAVHDFGAGDVIEIERTDGERAMLPFTRAVVPVVDLKAGRLVVEPPVEVEAQPEEATASNGTVGTGA